MKTLAEGLRPTPEDERDFPLGALITLPKLSELPESFILDTLTVKDQENSDYCAAFAFTLLSEIQEGVELSPEYQFALGKLITGDIDEWGLDLRSVLKSGIKFGSLEQRDAPFSLKNKGAQFLRDFNNWPHTLLPKIGFHKKSSFWKVTGPYDHYDNLRASMWQFRNEKRGAISGVVWQWPITQFLLSEFDMNGGGHAIPYIGWSDKGMIIQNSAGLEAGIRGRHTATREVVNHFVERYNAYMLVDLSPEEAKYYLENGIKLNDNWLVAILKAFISIFKSLWQ